MPEYLAPGVYVEEVSFRSKSIEGVPTSTTGFAGVTKWGPVYYPGGPKGAAPRLVTNFSDFERVYGGLERLEVRGDPERVNYMAHAARAFFANGGKRLYVSRVFSATEEDVKAGTYGVASLSFETSPGRTASWVARWPGKAGNVWLTVEPMRSKNVKKAQKGAIIEVLDKQRFASFEETLRLKGKQSLEADALYVVDIDENTNKRVVTGAALPAAPAAPAASDKPEDKPKKPAKASETQDFDEFIKAREAEVAQGKIVMHLVEFRVRIQFSAERIDTYEELGAHVGHKRYLGTVLSKDGPEDENALVYFTFGKPTDPQISKATAADAVPLAVKMVDAGRVRLQNGNDGATPDPNGPVWDSLEGKDANPDNEEDPATGLTALSYIDDIAIVAMPDAGAYGDGKDTERIRAATDALIGHAERLRYRIAVVDGPRNSSLNGIRQFRGRFDSTRAALYHPWVEILDPLERASAGAPPKKILLPPSGFVCGIYARSDIERGVHKAPANEVVRGLNKLEMNINHGRQEVINPEGINALRFFEGRGNRVWGARTMSSDPEWKYVNVRRLFIYIEHSIDKNTQWAVFEPNSERLWRNIRTTIEDFLVVLWKDGALMGSKPEESFFVSCDRTTMTQNEIDNGRMICLIGVSPVKPAEFVIFRIGQWTANAKN